MKESPEAAVSLSDRSTMCEGGSWAGRDGRLVDDRPLGEYVWIYGDRKLPPTAHISASPLACKVILSGALELSAPRAPHIASSISYY